jgi:hypothetical protein
MNLTPEDTEIVRLRRSRAWSMMRDDSIDARAMMAVEVRKEYEHRLGGYSYPGMPAERVRLYGDTYLREEIEAECGEPLL